MSRKIFIFFALITIVYVVNLFIDIMAVDALQYAEMCWEMLKTKSFLKVHYLRNDYLDKPPLLFWLGSLSYAVFGVHNFSYKLPSMLFALLGLYATYKLAAMYYARQTALIAAIILGSTQALFLITNDVRTDTLLLSCTVFSIWQWASFFRHGKMKHLLPATLGLALALMSKGPIAAIVLICALLPQLYYEGNWKRLLDYRLVLVIPLLGLLLLPMCIGLYEQWGMQGLRFFFWTQSFGRITGESPWRNNPDPLFLVHTSLWAFLPWSFLLFFAWGRSIWRAISDLLSARKRLPEWLSLFGFSLPLFSMMLSKYQLPHYAFVVYPLGAIMAAREFEQLATNVKSEKVLRVLQYIILSLFLPLTLILQYCYKGGDLTSFICLLLVYLLLSSLALSFGGSIVYPEFSFKNLKDNVSSLFRRNTKPTASAALACKSRWNKLFVWSLMLSVAFNFMMGTFYNPALMKYQCTNDFGRYIKTHNTEQNNFVSYHYPFVLPAIFYAQAFSAYELWDKESFHEALTEKRELLVITNEYGLSQIKEDAYPYQIVMAKQYFRVAGLNLKFLNPHSRDAACEMLYLVQVNTR
jgi:4-amino-4-deoxy-L-arabinose transferase-like glycosyltransferase